MGEYEEWSQPSGLLPNRTSSVIQILDREKWSKSEERTAELISCIRPNPPSELRRKAVAYYVERLIKKCFPCKVFTFGSVPLKTYLPDGDIDLTACSMDLNLKDTWAAKVCNALESEEKDEKAEFRVKEVQYIQAEVKLIKCLVENIVVDISFNQVGGLCTLCFLEEVDHLVNHNHLFKRSIILIKAWCYYESRILGAHHGLISTYALETLVLYIFHVYNNTFAGPLEVLYRFLEFFSSFDWSNFCLSLWGPVAISSLPDITAEPPRKDSGRLLLSKSFLEACSRAYAVENQGPPFVSKHFNVIDPLRLNNNLGRSVSRGNFYRIRSAFDYGAKRLAQILDCSQEDIVSELNQFFSNTWERHGSGHRPDAPTCLDQVRPLNSENDEHENTSSSQRKNKQSSDHEFVGERFESLNTHLTLSSSYSVESEPVTNGVSHLSHMQGLKGDLKSLSMSDQYEMRSSNQDRVSMKPPVVNGQVQGKYLFARTRSSPELTDTYDASLIHFRRNKMGNIITDDAATSKADNSKRKNITSKTMSRQGDVPSLDDIPFAGQIVSPQHIDVAVDSDSNSSKYFDNSDIHNSMREEHAIVGAQGMQQVEQDLVNIMNLSMHEFGGQFPMPLNLASGHLPLPLTPSMMSSFQRNMPGMFPGNFSLLQFPWGSNSSSLTQYLPGVGLNSNSAKSPEQINGNFSFFDMAHGQHDDDFWHERDENASFHDDIRLEIMEKDDKQPSTSGTSTFTQPSKFGGYEYLSRSQQKFNRENEKSTKDGYSESSFYQVNRTTDVYSDDRSEKLRLSSASKASSIRSKSSSESSWDESSVKTSKDKRERRGRGSNASSTSAAVPSVIHGKGKGISCLVYHSSRETDDESRDWNTNIVEPTTVERNTSVEPEAALPLSRNQLSSYEVARTSQSDSVMSINTFPLDLGSRQKCGDDSRMLFYPAGPPVPFLTMLPIYNVPSGSGNSDTSTSHHSREEEFVVNTNMNQGFKYYDGHNAAKHLNESDSIEIVSTIGKQFDEVDNLQSDFVSHWHNLQYGRSCINPSYQGPMVYPSPPVAPATYSQGQFPWAGRPIGGANQFMNFGPHVLPVAPLHGASNRPTDIYHHYVDDMPRFRGGTGTYLPNPKVSARERHSSGARRSSYNFDRYDDHADREGNWNVAKARSSERNHNRNQADKSSSRFDNFPSGESRSDRSWPSHQHESLLPSYHAHTSSLRSNSSAHATYGMYPIPGLHRDGLPSNGHGGPPLVMLYPYDRNYGCISHSELSEFSSVGPMGYMSSNEDLSLAEVVRPREPLEEQRLYGSSQMSSPDQQSSPQFQRHFVI